MTDVTADESIEEGIDLPDDEPESSTPRFSRKTIIFAAAGVLALLIVIGAGVFFAMPLFTAEQSNAPSSDVVFYDLPEMVVNLASASNKRTYLKIQISLELDRAQDVEALQKL
ncbi:MAG: hypothetical protein IIA00_00395, partial [Proteobacteria bacterium]|nr:hypothetical protein [Pseudomonadota bacterium]